MRQFVVVGHDAPTVPDFSLDDLAGGAGRLDVLCRCVNSAVFLSHDLRRGVRLWLVVRDDLAIRVEAGELRYANPDERNLASLLRGALAAREDAVGHVEAESTPGIHVSKRGLEPVLDEVAGDATLVVLHEDGDPVGDRDPPADPAFVLSDHRDFTDEEADLLDEYADARLRLGPERLHADHAITVAHNYLDTDGYRRF